MRIGTDISLSTCKDEGYLMMEYKVKDLIPKGIFNANCTVRFFSYVPAYLLKELGWTDNLDGSSLLLDTTFSANDLWELYLADKEAIDSFCGDVSVFPASASELLNLAADINSYRGLDR